ncbi:MAG: HNH endonuclease, partial [Nocardioidaceae bacterium]
AALQRGDTSEWRATVLARETACLSRADRARVDAAVGPRLAGFGDRRVWQQARRLAYQLDPEAAVRRARAAEADRRVTLRPAPDLMACLTGLLPVQQGVAAYASLTRQVDALKAQGDPRSRGQIMADEFAQRLTGQATADAVDAEITLVMGAETMFAGPTDQDQPTEPADAEPSGSEQPADQAAQADRPDSHPGTCNRADGDKQPADEPAHLHGYGPVPAWWARQLVRNLPARVWLRRAFARPSDGALVAMESTRRLFPEGLRRMLIVRDQTCRTPWCDAPIRHADHIQAHEDGGPTSLANGQGLCVACNLAKQAPGWTARPVGKQGSGDVELTTPTGHTYRSHPPPIPGLRQRPPPTSNLERELTNLLKAS